MKMKVRGIPIFHGVEQGNGKNSNRVYLYFKPNIAEDAKEWMRKTYGKEFMVEGKRTYKMLVEVINQGMEK